LHEYGAKAALPMWMQFMEASLKGQPDPGIEQPPGIMSIRVDPFTGARAANDDPQALTEYFMEPYLPTGDGSASTAETAIAPNDTPGGDVY
jgi:penicillin-binding protein 1A